MPIKGPDNRVSARRSVCLSIVAFSLVSASAAPAQAQGRAGMNAGQFEFSLPGARSLGMGGAFLAIAHDATAAYSNPAGLTSLTGPEISIELRDWSFTNTAIDSGHGFGDPTGIGVDNIEGLISKEYEASRQGISFLSAFYPGSRWTIGIFRHEIPRFRTQKEIQGPFFNCSGGFRMGTPPQEPFCTERAREDGIDRILPKQQEIEIDISSWGASLAHRFENISLSIGVSLLYHQFEINGVNRLFMVRGNQKYEPPDFSEDNMSLTAYETGNDSDLGVNVGCLWESTSWSVAGSFRQGPEFNYTIQRYAGPAHGSVLAGDREVGDLVNEEPRLLFKVPDIWSLGVAYRPQETVTLSFQYDLALFSQLTENFQDTTLPASLAKLLKERLTTPDANRIRIGFEKLWPSSGKIFALRAGSWYDSAHRTYFRADPETGFPSPQFALRYPEGDDQIHFSFGGGIVFKERIQLDAAVDLSDVTDTYSLSLVWRI